MRRRGRYAASGPRCPVSGACPVRSRGRATWLWRTDYSCTPDSYALGRRILRRWISALPSWAKASDFPCRNEGDSFRLGASLRFLEALLLHPVDGGVGIGPVLLVEDDAPQHAVKAL